MGFKARIKQICEYPDFPTPLEEVDLAVPFKMLNYKSVYIRVEAGAETKTVFPYRMTNPLSFNDDGGHVPIVDLATGYLFWMSKIKPCRTVAKR